MGSWGGARPNAGRPARGPIASSPHRPRPALARSTPLLIVARTLPRLRGRATWAALHRAFTRTLDRPDFRIIALTRHARRVVLLVEADHALALARGMQGFQVAVAKHLNRLRGRRGCVFADRYRARPLRTWAAVREVLGVPVRRLAMPQEIEAAPAELWIRTAWPETTLLERGPPS